MNKGIIIAIVVVLIIIIGGIFIANKKTEQTKMAADKAMMMKKDEDAAMMKAKDYAAMMKDKDTGKGEDAMMKKNEEIMMMAMQDTSSKKATLSDISGGTGTGKAFILRKGAKLYFTAGGNLTDPTTGTFYEGWLTVKGANPPKFVDTGKLTKQKDGSWEVSFSSDNLYEGYDMVVITSEKVDDQKPEKHILEGLAK